MIAIAPMPSVQGFFSRFSFLRFRDRLSSGLSALVWIVIVAAIPAAVWALIFVPAWQVGQMITYDSHARAIFALENEARRTVAQVVLGVFGLLALFVTWRRTRAAEKAVEVAESGQQTERFTKAIEQLGATDDKGQPRLEIRLGGIYALERLARESKDREYWTIIEVLTAYVRQNAPYEEDAEPRPDRKVRIDIQAILTVLGRRERGHTEPEPLDLHGADLRNADLRKANLERADLVDALLEGADLEEASLEGADLERANLRGAHMQGAFLAGADLVEASLREAHMKGANLERTELIGANLQGAYLKRAYLKGAYLQWANLQGAHLERAYLEGALLHWAHLEGAILQRAHLQGADLRESNVTAAQIADCYLDSETKLPEGVSPSKAP